MAGWNNRNAFVCVDAAEARTSGMHTNDGRGNLNFVQTAASTAPGYQKDFEVACVRCVAWMRHGALYTVWGRSLCPTGHITLHNGYMAGTASGAAYGGSQYTCLAADPLGADFSSKAEAGARLSKVPPMPPLAPAWP